MVHKKIRKCWPQNLSDYFVYLLLSRIINECICVSFKFCEPVVWDAVCPFRVNFHLSFHMEIWNIARDIWLDFDCNRSPTKHDAFSRLIK